MRQYEPIDVGSPMMNREPEEARKLGAEISLLEAKLRRVSATGFEHMRDLCVFGIAPPGGTEADVIQVLGALAKELGFIERDDKPKTPTRIRRWRAPVEATEEAVN